jgi:hypothetical protein
MAMSHKDITKARWNPTLAEWLRAYTLNQAGDFAPHGRCNVSFVSGGSASRTSCQLSFAGLTPKKATVVASCARAS